MIRAAAKDLARLRTISGILARHGYRHLAESLRRGKAPNRPEAQAEARAVGSAPARLRLLLQDLGPTFIKLGQMLSTRPDLVPGAYVKELSKLQDDVEPVPFEIVRAQLEAAWPGGLETHLADINPEPLATASIAQVHRATLPDGQEVVVKVQRPNLEATIRADIDLLYLVARFLDATVEEMSLYRPVEVVRAFERALLEELDFTIEARNARTIGANFADDKRVLVPAIIDALSGPEVLVMHFVAGTKITEIDPAEHDLDAIVDTLLDAAFKQSFVHGAFHADPHPGNLLVLPDDRICLLDFGMVGLLTSNMQQTLIQLALAIATRDAESTTRLICRIGQPQSRIPLARFRDEVSDLMARYLVRKLDQVDAATLLSELVDLALRYRIRIPPEYAVLAKATATLEGLMRQLRPDLDITRTVLPYAQQLMARRYGPEAVSKLAVQTAVGLLDQAQHLPLTFTQIISDLEAGRLRVQIANAEVDRLSRSLNDLGTKIFLGLITGATIVGVFFVLAQQPWSLGGWNGWALIGTIGASALTAAVLAWHLLYTRLKKVSLRTLIRLWRR